MTKREPRKDDIVSAAMAERKDMLILAQQKLDEIHRCNIGLSARPGSSSSRNRHRKSAMSTHLLSSLLYVALLSYKVEDMKALLREEDAETFVEWDVLLNSLHSPEFHARERLIQNMRAKTIYERKRQYKDVSGGLQQELTDTSNKLSDLQKTSNETSQQMSRAINILQDERSALVSKCEEKQVEVNRLNDQLHEIKAQLHIMEADDKRKIKTIDCLKQQLESKDTIVKDLDVQMSRLLQEQAAANEKALYQKNALEDLKSRLDQSESNFTAYKAEKELVVSELQKDIKEADTRHSVATTQLESTKQSLDTVRKELTECKSIASKLDALGADHRSNFADIKTELSNLDINLSNTESLVKGANDNQANSDDRTLALMKQSLEGNEKIEECVLRLSTQSDQIRQSFETVQHDVTSTNESISKLERLSDRIMHSLADVQVAFSATSTNDVIIARLENRQIHIEEMLVSVQKGMCDAIFEQNNRTDQSVAKTSEAANSMARLELQTRHIQDTLSILQELLDTRMVSSNGEAFSRLEGRTDQIQETLTSMQHATENEVAFARLEGALKSVQDALCRLLLEKSTNQILESSHDQDINLTDTHSVAALSLDDISMNKELEDRGQSALAAYEVVESCVAQAVTAISPTKLPI